MKAFYEARRDKHVKICISWNTNNICFPHFHQQIEMIYIEDGEINVSINEESTLLKKGEMAIIDSFDIHSFASSENALTTVLILPYSYISTYINFKRNRKLNGYFIKDTVATEKIHDLIRQLNIDNPNELSTNGIVNNILGIAVSSLEFINNNESSDLDFVREVLLYIDEHFSEELTIDSLSKRFGYSKHYFSRIFKNYTQNNFKEYLNSLRLKNAYDLMKQKVKPIDAAFESGFTSMQTFYRCFKDYYGKTPNEILNSEN